MAAPPAAGSLAVVAGSGVVPALVVRSAAAAGRRAVVFAIAGEADPEAFGGAPVHVLRWGEIGRLFRVIEEEACREAVFVGAVHARPSYQTLMPDLGAMRLMPRILKLLRGGDDSLLSGVAAIFAERGIRLASPVEVAPDLALPSGPLTRRRPAPDDRETIDKAAAAARAIGALDIGQAAVAVGGRVVALEAAEGTDDLLERVAALRRAGRLREAGGCLVKCMKPRQDPRLDLPTIGPATAALAKAAGLAGVAGEAGRTLLAGRGETIAAFDAADLFLVGLPAPDAADG